MNSPKEAAKYWKRVSITVNYDGFSEWYRATGCCRKLFWTIIMIGTVVPIVYYTYTVTKRYNSHPSATQLIEQQESSVRFPNVTICHSAKFNRTYVDENINVAFLRFFDSRLAFGTDDDLRKAFIQYLAYAAFQPLKIEFDVAKSLEVVYQGNFNESIPHATLNWPYHNFTSFVFDAGVECSKFLTRCAFGAKPFPCCENAKRVWTDYGTCYQLSIPDSDGSPAQTFPGTTGGLKVWATVDRSIVPIGGFDGNIGLRVHFTSNQVTPCDNPVSVPPNKHALIRIDATEFSFEPLIDGCSNSLPTLYGGVPYSQGSCTNECMQNISMERCQCKPLGFGLELDPSIVCLPRRMAECVLPLTVGYNSNEEDMKSVTDQMECVYNKCPKPCQQWVYDTFASYQNVVQAKYWPNNFTIEQKVPEGSDTYVFTAFFGEIKHTQIKSALLWDFNTFICNLGGLLGLWTGLSVITIVQVVIYCYYIPCCYEGGKTPTFLVPELYEEAKKANNKSDDG